MSKITKRILSSALCCALLLSFTACTENGESTEAITDTVAVTDAVTDAETLPPEETDGVVSVLAAGDNLVHEAVLNDALSRGRKNPNKTKRGEYFFTPMYDFAQNAGKRLTGRRSLDEFKDGGSVSPWARDGVASKDYT